MNTILHAERTFSMSSKPSGGAFVLVVLILGMVVEKPEAVCVSRALGDEQV